MTVLSIQKHSVTLGTSITAPSDLTFTADTPPNVQMTSPLVELPSMVVGDVFAVEDHVSHNGRYEVITVTTEFENYLVESLTGSTGAASPEQADIRLGDIAVTANLTGTPDTTNCVPFTTTRITALSDNNDDSFEDYTVGVDFLTSPGRVQVQGSSSGELREVVAEVSVVEFDPTIVNVYQGTASMSGDNEVVNAAFGGGPVTVDLTKAWLYFTYHTTASADVYQQHAVRGRITSTSQLTFDCSETTAAEIEWYVVECQGTEWSVETSDINLPITTGTSETDTITSVTTAKTFILGSHKGGDGTPDGDGPDEQLVDVVLTNATTVTATRQTAGLGTIDWHGFVVEFAGGGNENVYRDTLTWSTSEASTTDTISTAVTIADSVVHLAGHTGILAGGHWKLTTDSSSRVPDTFTAWTITGTTQVTVTHDTTGGESSQDLSWEVIEWDVEAGAPPGTRRVMVVS